MKRTHMTPKTVNLGGGGRGATRRRSNAPMAERTKQEWMDYALDLEAALRAVVNAYTDEMPMRTADMHDMKCGCLRCAVDAADAITR